ncbi:hypothetical protein [Vibrio sp. SCSIO 43136]|uniref:hypothetical protein n=1 Tax=Vibrio sp. SCSIO 43136 TaxID=2819101 RepID=UPI002074D392|nr:hypothetical protein [Vibrio sp. SCSIO 43136]USD64262.1 hypothetical protein J4N39_09080 [Vibrio sp. SCSIO 43136]
MKKAFLAVTLAALSSGAMANEVPAQEEQVNYGDPTASFSTLGVSRSDNATQLNMMVGAGANIYQLDLTANDHKFTKESMSYRGRYFHVTDGIGYSVDVLGDMKKNNASTTALAGMIYKFQVTDNVMVFPMLSAGYTHFGEKQSVLETGKDHNSSTLIQGGVYAMYGFDAGHWVYANPKVTRVSSTEQTIPQVELGGGFMVADNASIGLKLEHTGKVQGKTLASELGEERKAETTTWIQANYYF